MAIVLVVAVVLGLVLLSLPRLLEGYFLEQEQTILEARAESMATILAGELAEVSGSGAVPLILPGDDAPGGSTQWTLGDAAGGSVRDLTEKVAQADVHVAAGPGRGPGRGVGARRGAAR